MKIVMPGGSGQVGTLLARSFAAAGHEVVVVSRREPAAALPWRFAAWDGATLGPWAEELEGADVVINLAGRSVNCRYTPANRRAILDSRVNSTRVVGEAIAAATNPPSTWLQSSTATIYSHRYDAPNDETRGIIDGSKSGAEEAWGFSVEVARAWERECQDSPARVRKVLLRSSMVMSPDRGGIFDTLLTLVRRGLGGTSGDGRQFVSWISDRDFIRALDVLIEDESWEGPVNLAAPHPLPNAEFMKALREAWGARIGLPATRWMLELGAVFMRTETELVLKSRRVVPGRLQTAGFEFQFPEWPQAARDLCDRVRRGRLAVGDA